MQTAIDTSAHSNLETRSSWLDRPLINAIPLNWETVLFATILVLAIVTRFYKLENRVMSHDETSHVYFSWLLSQGRGYMHDPVTHGPFQFHVVALSYFLFSDNDFTARIPAVLFSIASVAFLWFYRRYLGRAGVLVAALLFVISPYMLYYGRYVRNESFVAFWGLLTLWSVLRYFDTGSSRYLYILSAAISMHFATKETAYIYTAQLLLFLGLYFVYRVTQQPWIHAPARRNFLLLLIASLVLLAGAGGIKMLAAQPKPGVEGLGATTTSMPGVNAFALLLVALAVLALAGAIYFLIRGYTLESLRLERSFDLLILVGALVLPLLSAFVINMAGWKVPTNAGEVNAMTLTNILQMLVVVVLMFLIANALGFWWNWQVWLGNFALFYTLFTVLYTTLFTNGAGLATGLVGGLGYWLAQQAVERGSQPWYYYILVQVPVYEYLPALGSLLAIGWALARVRVRQAGQAITGEEGTIEPGGGIPYAGGATSLPETQAASSAVPETLDGENGLAGASSLVIGNFPTGARAIPHEEKAPFLPLTIFWVITSAIAYSIAGEKMPWLTVHIALPMIVLAGWYIGQVIESTRWSEMLSTRGILILALLPVFLTSSAAALGSLLGTTPPFQGQELAQLQVTSAFITAFLAAVASGWGLAVLMKRWDFDQNTRLFGLAFLALLTLLTARTAFTASYINYDLARELLVYAHSGPGAKEAMAQIDEISRRTTKDLSLEVAYDDQTSYPFWWYLRNYPNQRFYGKNPTRDIREAPIILVGDENYQKVENIVGNNYQAFEYIRMWWPDQGYFGLTLERILYAVTHPEWRSALFQIWLNRDYTEYARLINKDLSLPNWDPANRFRMYIRNDVVAKIWNYGSSPSKAVEFTDPYEGHQIKLAADIILGAPGTAPGQFMEARGIAVAPDGSIYVADSMNHRIQHLAPDGSPLHVWGSYADVAQGNAPGGTFNQPWGIAVAPDGSVYVADTWNHRIQKFTADGQFITMWGYGISQTDDPLGFYGPRGIAVDSQGYVYVTDTGNKRVVIFDQDGQYVAKFGSPGFEPGQLNEPVGIALNDAGHLYVADVWNQRIQEFSPSGDWFFDPVRSWDIVGWYGQSLNNYPYLAVDGRGHVFATDPEGYRVLEFTGEGQFVRYWGDFGTTEDTFSLPIGIATDPQGGIWVMDSGSSRLMHFTLPPE